MDTMQLKIFVIIVTWNGMKWLPKCMEALLSSSIPVNIVVIDNNSTDETKDFFKQSYPEVEVIASESNLGFGQANNIGLKYALDHGADYMFLLNQDAYIKDDMFEQLLTVAESQKHSVFGLYLPLHLKKDRIHFDNNFKIDIADVASDMTEDALLSQPKCIYEIDFGPAAGWFLPRMTVEKIGGFDPIFYHYGEDNHYCNRVLYHGYKIGIVPSARMVHDRGESFGNKQLANKDSILRFFKSEIFLNIRLSKKQMIKKYLKICGKYTFYSVKCILSGELQFPKSFVSAIFQSLLHLQTFRDNRRHNRIVGRNWL